MPISPLAAAACNCRISGGPGFIFLTIIDTHKLSGKIIYVLRAVGTADSQFSLTVD